MSVCYRDKNMIEPPVSYFIHAGIGQVMSPSDDCCAVNPTLKL